MIGQRRDALQELLALAYRQAGYFTAGQAVTHGLSYQAQKYHVDRGNWLRVERGIFRLRDWPATLDDAYVLWTLWSRQRGVISHDTALAVHGLGVLDLGAITLTVPPGFRATTPAVRTVVATLLDGDIEQRDGFRVTTPLRTLVDVAGQHTQESLDEAVADALAGGLVSARALRDRADTASDRAALRIERAISAAGR